jgi:hypothetical protein
MARPLAEPLCAVVQAAAFAVEGHPAGPINGTYRPRGQHEGWPRFENERGMHLYRYRPGERWFLGNAFTPEKSGCHGYIAAVEGPIPTGVQRWMCWVNGKHGPRTVTVTALVSALSPRPVHVCRLACALSLASPLGADIPACIGVTVATPYMAETGIPALAFTYG